ncbi:hypothetical protein [Nocardioides sp.]|uniref:hypothetical protein n=1 Tax=Nocardioides sp. TaxID=35761 RepID=UPI002D11A676|nr:hypothetical protein [Nocardioides sp.]HXH79523.1 hypothetical protein [Nocardioides sp.]
MATSRAQATQYLDAVLAPSRDLAGVAAGDWDVAIDGALLALGHPTTTEPYAGDALGYRAVLRWSALTFLADRLADQVDNGNPEGNARWSQAAAQVAERAEKAAIAARPYCLAGELVTGGYGTPVTLVGDWLAVWP